MTFVRLNKILILFSLMVVCSCMSETAKQTIEEYNRMFEKVTTLEQLVQTADFSTLSGEEIVTLYNTGNELYYDYNPMDLKEEQKSACEALKERVARLRVEISSKAKAEISNFKITPWPAGDKLFEKAETFPVFLKRGEKLRWAFMAQKPMNVKVSEYNSRTTLKAYTGKMIVNDSLAIEHDAIYLIEVNPLGRQYIDMDVNYKITDMARLTNATPIKVEQVECEKGDYGAVAVPGV